MSETTWRVSAMAVADLPVVNIIERQAPSPWSLGQLTEELTCPGALQLVCHSVSGEHMAGFLMARFIPGEMELLKIATAQDFQRHGVASLLLQSAITFARQQDLTRIYLELRSQNIPARTLYEKFTFEMTGRRPNYYTAPKDDALCMTLRLDQKKR